MFRTQHDELPDHRTMSYADHKELARQMREGISYDYFEHCERFQRRWERACSSLLVSIFTISWVGLFIWMVASK